MKRILGIALAAAMIFAFIPAMAEEKPALKNVILLIPDGQSSSVTTLARWYNGGKSLNLDEMACGLVRTFIADSAIADSAPAGTAYAAGVKSHTGYIGVLPDEATMPGLAPIPAEDRKKPVANVLEAARLQGKSTGIVATSEIMHATPAAFTAHYPDRKNYDDLSEQQVYQGVDLVLGGGAKYFTSEVRGDKEDLIGEIKNLGYEYITTPDELKNFDGGKLWGMFADTDMAYEFDRDPAKEPSLSEMTAQAIQLLSKNENGFFLMVEGSKIDWAAHANDPIGVICDTLAFDEAVGVALEFAKADGNTAVISVADHATGGLSIGSPNTDANYDKVHIDNYIVPLKKAALTGEGVEKKLNSDKSNIVEVMSQYYGVSDLTGAEIDGIKAAQAGSLNYTVGPIISKRANLGWTTIGHTGEDVPLYVYAPEGHKISGVIDSTQIAKYIAEVLGLDLDAVSEKLFISARKGFEAKGAAVSWDASDEKNPVITAEKDGTVIKIPVNKNVAYINGEKTLLDGVVVYNGETTYVPQSAIDLLEE